MSVPELAGAAAPAALPEQNADGSRANLPRGAAATRLRVRRASGATAREVLARMDAELPLFATLSAEDRAAVGLLIQRGLKAFGDWLESDDADVGLSAQIFADAPRQLMRTVSLEGTVDMVRVAIDVVETHVAQLAEPDSVHWLREAVLRYSRELGFAAAQVYARAAEVRGAWDARLEALVVDGLLRDDPGAAAALGSSAVLSRAAALGWRDPDCLVAVAGCAPDGEPEAMVDEMHVAARRLGVDLLAGLTGRHLVAFVGTPDDPLAAVPDLVPLFRPGPVVVGPVVVGLAEAARSARAALAGVRVAAAWPDAPCPVGADQLLPERVLGGDGQAVDELLDRVYEPLAAAGGELLATVAAYLECAGSLDGAARQLYVHTNTVRYRLRRVTELTGLSATTPRDAFTLRIAMVHGRLREASRAVVEPAPAR